MMTHSILLRGCALLAAFVLGACAYPVNGPEDAVKVEQRFPITVWPKATTRKSAVVPFQLTSL